jgi:hypothetical protein
MDTLKSGLITGSGTSEIILLLLSQASVKAVVCPCFLIKVIFKTASIIQLVRPTPRLWVMELIRSLMKAGPLRALIKRMIALKDKELKLPTDPTLLKALKLLSIASVQAEEAATLLAQRPENLADFAARDALRGRDNLLDAVGNIARLQERQEGLTTS